ncbi:MAG: hypothetical protein ACK47B_11660 [Armatimonadota bacterium]
MAQMAARPALTIEKRVTEKAEEPRPGGLYLPDGPLTVVLFAALAAYLALGCMAILFVSSYLIHKGAP